VLGVLTIVGLLSALLGEGGPFWLLSWGALSMPLLAIALAVLRSRFNRPG
jgi:amino acid transporter